MKAKDYEKLISDMNVSDAAQDWATDNVWLSDHEDDNGNLNKDTYMAEIYSKVVEYVENIENA